MFLVPSLLLPPYARAGGDVAYIMLLNRAKRCSIVIALYEINPNL